MARTQSMNLLLQDRLEHNMNIVKGNISAASVSLNFDFWSESRTYRKRSPLRMMTLTGHWSQKSSFLQIRRSGQFGRVPAVTELKRCSYMLLLEVSQSAREWQA
jgi:hypothetical protein